MIKSPQGCDCQVIGVFHEVAVVWLNEELKCAGFLFLAACPLVRTGHVFPDLPLVRNTAIRAGDIEFSVFLITAVPNPFSSCKLRRVFTFSPLYAEVRRPAIPRSQYLPIQLRMFLQLELGRRSTGKFSAFGFANFGYLLL